MEPFANLEHVAQLEKRLVDLQYAEKLQHALFKISSFSHEDMDLQQLYRKVHLIIDDVLDAKNFFIALFDDENQTINLPYFVDEQDFDEKDMTGRTLDLGKGLSSYVIRTRKPQLITADVVTELIINDEIQDVLGSTDFRCWMGAPMISAETLHGIIVVQTYSEGENYNHNDLKLLDFVANQVGTAIEINVNTSQRIKAQLKLAEQHRILEQKNLTLTKTIKDLKKAQEELVQKEKMASLGGLVAGIAHEINTPLGICVTATSHLTEEQNEIRKAYESGVLTEDCLNEYFEEFQQGLKILSSNTKRAAELVKSFKQVAVDQSSNEVRIINFFQYIQEILLSLKPALKRVNHEINIDCSKNLNVGINAGAISQIFSNLIMNSIIHGFEGIEKGSIQIKVSTKANQLKIHYADNGKGIDEHSLGQLFDPFFTTKRGEGGSGLGTHLIYNLVHSSLNGTIKAQSEPDKGLAYLIKVPVSI